jgi:hypothetical protein
VSSVRTMLSVRPWILCGHPKETSNDIIRRLVAMHREEIDHDQREAFIATNH